MHNYNGQERRRTERITLTTYCPSKFMYKGKEISALMVNLSELGAGFAIEEYTHKFTLVEGEELTYKVRTPYGESTVKGVIAWTRRSDEHYSWGVEFTELSSDEKDPLRTFINSPF
jgi:hypothetical protein